MRTFGRSGVVLMLIAIVVGACARTGPPAEQMADPAVTAAAVDSINQAYLAAVAARDTNAIVALYAADARLMPPNATAAVGPDSIRAAWIGFLQIPDLQLNTQSTQIIGSDSGDLAVDVGTYTFSGKLPNGQSMTDVGKYVTVMKKVDGQWKIVVDTFNSDLPAPGM
jgi:uncharacterized protein (TIGR02246 family)